MTHITEAIWFNPRKALPDSNRPVLVVFKHFEHCKFTKRVAQAQFVARDSMWKVDSTVWNPSQDVVTQWAELDINRQGMMPDDFPRDVYPPEFVSNKL